jgi:hypothetical protein
MTHRFVFAWDLPYRLAALPFGITPWTAYAEVSPSELRVRFGLWSLRTPVSNVVAAEASGGYSFVKTAGPAHLSFSDRGVTFATTGRSGVCVRFDRPVPAIAPAGLVEHPGATLTVADVEGFADALGLPLQTG